MPEQKPIIAFTPVADPVHVHRIAKAINYGGNVINEIAIRAPNGHDLLMIGSPVIADPTSDREARIDFAIAYRLASALSGLPEKILYDADPAEMIDLFWKIGSFFIPGWQGLLPAMRKLKAPSSEAPGLPVS